MTQQPLFVEDIYDALRHAIGALGGAKIVGHQLWPHMNPAKAGEKLNDCLNRDRPQKLDPEEIQMISRLAGQAGCHTVAHFQATDAGYSAPDWRTPEDIEDEGRRELAALLKQVVPALKKAGVEL